MKKILVTGPVLLILMAGTLIVLVTSTDLLLPKKFKDRNTLTRQNEFVEHTNHVVDDGYESIAPDLPLFNDDIDLSNLTVEDPATYKNLQICLISGPADLDHKKYVTLNKALKANMVTVHETQEVNELSLDNNSDEYIYINSGEIVKGGQQDRTIQYDVVIAPREKNVDLASFCVESGRWQQRGDEDYLAFRSSEKMVSNTSLKVAAKYDKDQSKVWNEVAAYQEETEIKVNEIVGSIDGSVDDIKIKNKISESSLELTLENEEIEKIQKEYKENFFKQMGRNNRAVGFAYFINGKLCGIDIYNNHQLFADLYDKLLDAVIAEAISMYNKKDKPVEPNYINVNQLLPANANVYQDEVVNTNTQFRTSQHNRAKTVLIFTSFDKKAKAWLHRNWLEDNAPMILQDENNRMHRSFNEDAIIINEPVSPNDD
jgi:hypothetical protein